MTLSHHSSTSLKFTYTKDGVAYYKSALSNNQCVTVGVERDSLNNVVAIKVGDSKHPNDPPKVYTAEEWTAFLSTARSGGFDPSIIK